MPKNRVTFPDGTYVEDPYYIDYHDGEGPKLAGRTLYSQDGKAMGHIDPPGPKGFPGTPGFDPNEQITLHNQRSEHLRTGEETGAGEVEAAGGEISLSEKVTRT